jgi:hypothetical protein
MYRATHVADNIYYTKSFVYEMGMPIGEPTAEMPLVPEGFKLIADMDFELDLYTAVSLVQDVSNPEHYKFCYERYANQGDNCKITMELFLITQEEVNKCEIELIDPDHKWEWDNFDR